jgi:hypothetical protein
MICRLDLITGVGECVMVRDRRCMHSIALELLIVVVRTTIELLLRYSFTTSPEMSNTTDFHIYFVQQQELDTPALKALQLLVVNLCSKFDVYLKSRLERTPKISFTGAYYLKYSYYCCGCGYDRCRW